MKTLSLLFSLALAQTCLSQFKVSKLDKNLIPKSIRYSGNIIQSVRWADSTGDNIVILTKEISKSKTSPDESFSNGTLYAYHYLVLGDSVKQTWKVYDYVKECDVDMFLNFIDKTFAITDLNKDGKAEIWLMYKISCQGDVSPIPMKIIMFHDNKKFAVRGTTRVKISEKDFIGGEYSFDEAFKSSPAEFKAYAEKLWKQHKIETWNNP